MTDKVFEYGGVHFVPERQLKGKENEFTEIAKKLRIDKALGFCKKDYAYESKFDYSFGGFYTVATDKQCDLFRCVENGKLYIPCKNDLQEYVTEDEYLNYRQAVAANVGEEFVNFRDAEMRKSKEEIFNDYYEIHFYNELKEYLTADGEDHFLDDTAFKCLYQDGKSVLACLYDYYLKDEYSSMANWEEITDFIHRYNERYYENILNGGTEIE